tara:strand:- start:188 stop:370 length:183 start_codon:yes stop_codon:yes gene_type:complete
MGGSHPIFDRTLYTLLMNFNADDQSPIGGQTLEDREAATKVYLEQLRKATKRKLPPKDTY